MYNILTRRTIWLNSQLPLGGTMAVKKPKVVNEKTEPVRPARKIVLNEKGLLGGLAKRNKERDAQLNKLFKK